MEDELDIYNNEQIHLIGAIQDVGFVICVKLDFTIIAISENLVKAPWTLQSSAADVLGKNITDMFDAKTSILIKNLISRFQSIVCNSDSIPYARNFTLLNTLGSKGSPLQVDEKILCCSVVGCSNKDTFILEFEDSVGQTQNELAPNPRILRAGDIAERIRNAESIEAVTASFADLVMETMLAYDRCMVYRFGADGTGHVMYEHARDHLESKYLGLRFPAEDIPVPARKLFVKNGVRFIYDCSGVDSKIITSESELDQLDLTMCSLRAASKCHCQYLSNMGVTASMSVAIVIEDKLWGLYAFHSYGQNTKPTVDERIMLEMSASITAMKIDAFQRERYSARKLEANKIMLILQSIKSLHEFLSTCASSILGVVEADAVAVYECGGSEGRIVFGDTFALPTQQGYTQLCARCKMNSYVALNRFNEGLSGDGAGVLFFKYQYVIVAFVRKTTASDVKWGGNPDRCHDPTVPLRLCPRTSFELFLEKGRKESRPWSNLDCEIAEFVMDRIDHFLHSEMLASFRLSLEQTNSECLQAIESARERYEFFAQMSHELRTPFHGVMSSLQLLKSSSAVSDEAERKELIQSALECGKTMLRTLDDILTIAKSKTFVELTILPIVLSKIAATTLRMMSPIAEHKTITLRSELGQLKIGNKPFSPAAYESLVVMGDETRLGQIANNLTSNAIKFTAVGGEVIVRTHIVSGLKDVWKLWDVECERFLNNFISRKVENCTDEKNTSEIWYIFEVEDNGCGVSGGDMHTMFDAYKQLSSDAPKTYQGTGLGLHICRLHIEKLGGVFGVASTVGKGTLFIAAIPMNLIKENLEATLPSLQVSESGISVHFDENMDESLALQQSLFMIVDDSVINLKLSKRKLLLALGDSCTVVTAEDGLASIALYEEYIEEGKQPLINGIFMDYHMPKCSGLEAIKEIRKIEQRHSDLRPVYIIAFTADMSETSSRELMHAGANEVLPKPPAAGQLESISVRLATVKKTTCPEKAMLK